MGYYSYFSGSIEITPPLPEGVAKMLRHHLAGGPYTVPWLNYEIHPEWELDETGSQLLMPEDECRGCAAEKELKYLIDRFIPEGHKVEGVMEVDGGNTTDNWVIRVVDRVVYVQAYVLELVGEPEKVTLTVED